MCQEHVQVDKYREYEGKGELKLLLFRISQNCPMISSVLMMNVQVPKDSELFRLNT